MSDFTICKWNLCPIRIPITRQYCNNHEPIEPCEKCEFANISCTCKELEEGRKDDANKLRYYLIPVSAERVLAEVLTYGAKKYADRNWEKGIAFSRLYAALRRHISDFWSGQDKDSESGLSHLGHAMFCLAAMQELLETHPEFDDRPKK